jgi:hypothetical protein
MAAAALRPHLALLSGGGGIPNPALRTLSIVSPLLLHIRSHRSNRHRGILRSNASSSPPSPPPSPEKEAVPTAESCVNLGLELFSKGRVSQADSESHFFQRSSHLGYLLVCTEDVYQYELGIVREFIRHLVDKVDVSFLNLDAGAPLVNMLSIGLGLVWLSLGWISAEFIQVWVYKLGFCGISHWTYSWKAPSRE